MPTHFIGTNDVHQRVHQPDGIRTQAWVKCSTYLCLHQLGL